MERLGGLGIFGEVYCDVLETQTQTQTTVLSYVGAVFEHSEKLQA